MAPAPPRPLRAAPVPARLAAKQEAQETGERIARSRLCFVPRKSKAEGALAGLKGGEEQRERRGRCLGITEGGIKLRQRLVGMEEQDRRGRILLKARDRFEEAEAAALRTGGDGGVAFAVAADDRQHAGEGIVHRHAEGGRRER